MQNDYVNCEHCYHWTEKQKTYNVCQKCNNKRFLISGKHICTECKGTKKYVKESCPFYYDKELTISHIKNLSKARLPYEEKDDPLSPNAENKSIPFQLYNIDGGCKFSASNKHFKIEYHATNKQNNIEDIESYKYQFLLCKDPTYIKNEIPGTIIGDLEFMNTLLSVTKFKNGDPIKYIENNKLWELALENGIPAYCYLNNNPNSGAIIYNEHAFNDKRGIIPNGWRALSNADLKHLRSFLGFPFNLSLQISPIKSPNGFRKKSGEWVQGETDEDYFFNVNFDGNAYNMANFNGSGYVLCVRDAQGYEQYLIEIEKQKKEADMLIINRIIENIKNDHLEEALEEIQTLTYPEEFPSEYMNLVKQKQDEINLKKIQDYLFNKKPEEAARTYSLLNFPTIELKNKMLEKLKENATNIIDLISKDEFEKFLFENKSNLYDLSVGKHVLKSDVNGNVFIDNSKKIYGKLETKHVKKYGEFEVPIRSQYEFEVTSTIEDIVGLNLYNTGTKNYIYKKANNKYYKSKKPSKKHKTIETTFDTNISKNRLCIMQPRLECFRIEDYKYLEKKIEPRLVKEYKVSNDIARATSKPVKILGFSILALWGGLRAFEYLKIP
jgi:hypothetical protein